MKNTLSTGLCIISAASIIGCCSISTTATTDSNSSLSSDNVESVESVESELEKAMTLIDGIVTFIVTTIYYK